MNAPRRLGLLVDSLIVPAWIARLAERLSTLEGVQVALIVNAGTPPAPHTLVDSFFDLDQHLQRGASNLFGPSDLHAALPNVLVIKPSELQSNQLDILISFCNIGDCFGSTLAKTKENVSLRGGRSSRRSNPQLGNEDISLANVTPRLGVWMWNDVSSSSGFRAVLDRAPLMTCSLIAHLPNGEDKVIRNAVFATDWISVARNRNHFFIKAASTLVWALKKLSLEGEEKFLQEAETVVRNGIPQTRDLAGYHPAPQVSLFEVAALAFKQAARKLEKYFRPRETWLLMVGKSPAGLVPALDGSRPIVPPRGVYWADPIAVERDGQVHVVVEEYVREVKRGRIVCLTLDDEGQVASRQVALERPYHLSYPFVFEFGGKNYMIPETASQRTIELYHCTRWPDRWEFARNLMSDVYAVDSTLFFYGSHWWMFTNIKTEPGASSWDELHLFYADDPLSANWTPHPLNPVLSDVRLARPAGRIFEFEGRLYRPSQDCSLRYGYALNFNRIETLTERDYAEAHVEKIFPRPDMRTLHTFSRAGGWDFTDGATRKKMQRD
jgi:hypothetical protein